MKKNPVIPYAIIAVIGIFAVIIISVIGINQRDDIQKAEEGGDNATEETQDAQEGETTGDPEAIFKSNCSSCHGGDLSGGMGPDLRKVGAELSEEEIHDIAVNGKGDMPPGMATKEEADILAKWLSEKK